MTDEGGNSKRKYIKKRCRSRKESMHDIVGWFVTFEAIFTSILGRPPERG